MASRPVRQTIIVTAAAALLFGAAGLVQLAREQKYPISPIVDESLYLRSGRALRNLSIGYQALAADLYWIRAIQYYGSTKLAFNNGKAPSSDGRSDYSLLYPLLDLTTSADPRFNIAYRFGAVFLAEAPPAGPGRPELAIALLEKGLRERPDKWEYMQDIGFVHYWWTHDFKAAADWFNRAGAVPGAPWFLKSLAATTLAEGGDRRSSRLMWESIRQSAEIEWLRNEADRRLAQLSALDFIDKLQSDVDAFAARAGAPPSNWDALIRERVIPGLPLDPTGTPYEIIPPGRVGVSPRSRLFPLPTEPQRLSDTPIPRAS